MERAPLSKPRKSVALPFDERKRWKCVSSLTDVPIEKLVAFLFGTSFVSIMMKPPEKSAGYCGAGDLMICRLSTCDEGMMSNENALESASLEGTAAPLIHTLL